MKIKKYSKIIDIKDKAKELKWSWSSHAQRLDDDRWEKKDRKMETE